MIPKSTEDLFWVSWGNIVSPGDKPLTREGMTPLKMMKINTRRKL
jgi:hypothetical protein